MEMHDAEVESDVLDVTDERSVVGAVDVLPVVEGGDGLVDGENLARLELCGLGDR